MSEMADITEQFRATFKFCIKNAPHGEQARIARKMDVSSKHVNDILAGRRNPGQDLQKKICDDLGYSYENFIALGRMLLDGVPEEEVERKASVLRKRPDTHRVEKSFNIGAGNHTVQEGDEELFLTSDERRLLGTYRKLNDKNKYHALITLMEMEVMQFKNQNKDT